MCVRHIVLQLAQLGIYQEQVSRISSFAPQYDSATGVRANGYRSFVRIAGTFVGGLTEFLVKIHAKGTQVIDRK